MSGAIRRSVSSVAALAGLVTALCLSPAPGSAGTPAAGRAERPLPAGLLPAGLFRMSSSPSSSRLSGLYCTSADSCWAVGTLSTSGGATLNQVLRWNGRKWRSFPVPQPGGTARNDVSSLSSVRCNSAKDCWALGYFVKSGANLDQVLHWNGTKWSGVSAPTPGGILSGDFNELNDVYCTSPGSCRAVGSFGSRSTTTITTANQALRWNGKGWSLVGTPNPAGTSGDDLNMLAAVRCNSASACLAVGDYGTAGLGNRRNEALRWNGKKWSLQTTPNPAGTTTNDINLLNGLACGSAASCWAVGYYATVSPLIALNDILHWNGKKWSKVGAPNPGGTGTDSDNSLIWDVCVSARDCWAVGSYGQTGGTTTLRNQILHWNGAKWSKVGAPDPGGTATGSFNVLFGARCTSAANCWAVGERDEANTLVDEILHWNGKKWVNADATIADSAVRSG